MSNPLPDFFSSKEKAFDLKATLYHYVASHWYWYLLFPILGYLGAWAYLRYTVPEYEVKCTLLIKDDQKGGISETALLQELGVLQETKNIENEVQILKSQTLMEEVVRDLNLRIRYFAIGRVRNEEMYRNNYIRLDSFQLNSGDAVTFEIQCMDSLNFNLIEGDETPRPIRFGAWFETARGRFLLTRQFQQPILDQGQALIQVQSTESMARGYIKHLLVKPVSYYSSVLELKLREPIARRAADVLNKLVDVYNSAAVEDKNKVSENTVAFIDQRLLYLTEELSTVESGVQQYKQKNQITTSIESGLNLVLEEMSAYDQSLTQWEVQRNVLKNLETYMLQMRVGEYQLIPVHVGAQEEALTQLIQQFNIKLLDRDRLAQTAKPENPARIGLELELKSLYEGVLETLRKVSARTEAQLTQARNNRLTLSGKVREVPRMERELQEIMRQQAIKQNLYLFLLQKREETLLALASTSANSRVVDPARPTKLPVKPQKKLVYLLSILLGLAFPPLLVLLKDLLNDTVQGENDLQKVSDAPILGGIARSKNQNGLIVGPKSRSAGAEMFRLLRTNLQFLLPPNDQKGQTLLITSSASGDGKTFVTANLGMTIALSGKKTLLIELDLRKPKLLRYLEAPLGEKGMTHYLLGQATQRDIVHPSKQHENLFYIPSGPIPPNPAELLLSPTLETLFEFLQSEFDFILIDTSPVGLVADALLLNRFSTASMYVVRQGATKKGMLKTLVNIHQEKKLRNLAVIINGIQAGRGAGYGYGYGGYGYGYYEEEAAHSASFWSKWMKRFYRS